MLASRLVVFRALLTLAHRVVCIDDNLGVHNPAHEHDTVVLSTRHQRACSASDSTVVVCTHASTLTVLHEKRWSQSTAAAAGVEGCTLAPV
jgi:hypothetical protein